MLLPRVNPRMLRGFVSQEREGRQGSFMASPLVLQADDSDAILRGDPPSVHQPLEAADLEHHVSPLVAGLRRPQGQREAIDSHLEDRKSTRLNSSHVKISYAV